MPSTLPRSLKMPAMALMAPLWFQFGSIMPSGEAVAERHPALALEPRDGLAVGDVVAFAVRDRDFDHLAGIVAARERRIGALDAQIDVAADETELGVAHEHAGQQPRLAGDLKAVADGKDEPALLREGAHGVP